MKYTELTVVSVLSRAYFAPELSETDFPPEVSGRLKKGSSALESSFDGAVLLVTDSRDLIKAFVNRRLKNSYAVYIGDPFEIESAFDRVTDIWSPFDGGALLKKRYRLLLDHIRCRTELQELKQRGN
ncbi:MAG: hypothetical protein IJ746_08185 [Ruminococcus sp.]|nr:hypothetical protein [Ruminococcus sp.]